MRRVIVGSVIGIILATWPSGAVAATKRVGDARSILRPDGALSCDFNGDGFRDFAVGASWETVSGHNAAGGVNVLYGSSAGLGSNGNQFFTQDSAGIPDQAEKGDNFGSGLAHADFNGDGFGDLAVGAPSETVGGRSLAGRITVIFGSPSGLSSAGSELLTGSVSDDQLGYSLVATDFDQDGFGDLAAGLPNRRVNGLLHAGAVEVFYGSAAGLSGAAAETWTQDTPGIPDQAEGSDGLGYAVGAGDFTGDGAWDLAAAAAEEGVNGTNQAGAVNVIYGSRAGLTASGAQVWTQDSAGIGDRAEDDDEFGAALATGDLNGDGAADLAIGSYGESLGDISFAGSVNVIYGSGAGLKAAGSQFWTQDSPGVPSRAGVVERFGSALAAGDFDGDGRFDLAIGVPGEEVGGAGDAGAANVLYGSAGGLTTNGTQFWSEGSPGILEDPEPGDYWAGALSAGDWGDDGRADLAASSIYESYGNATFAGGVSVLYGAATGLVATGNQFWSQDSPGVRDQAETDDLFGYAVA